MCISPHTLLLAKIKTFTLQGTVELQLKEVAELLVTSAKIPIYTGHKRKPQARLTIPSPGCSIKK